MSLIVDESPADTNAMPNLLRERVEELAGKLVLGGTDGLQRTGIVVDEVILLDIDRVLSGQELHGLDVLAQVSAKRKKEKDNV